MIECKEANKLGYEDQLDYVKSDLGKMDKELKVKRVGENDKAEFK